jgi:hypothetical protein
MYRFAQQMILPHQFNPPSYEQNAPLWTDLPSSLRYKEGVLAGVKMAKMICDKIKYISPVYSCWVGKSVVLLVLVRKCHVPLACNIIGETVADIRVRVQPGWEMNVRKELVLAVEEDLTAPGIAMYIHPAQPRLSAGSTKVYLAEGDCKTLPVEKLYQSKGDLRWFY